MAARTSGSIEEAEELDDDEIADVEREEKDEENGAALCREGLKLADAARWFLLLLLLSSRRTRGEGVALGVALG